MSRDTDNNKDLTIEEAFKNYYNELLSSVVNMPGKDMYVSVYSGLEVITSELYLALYLSPALTFKPPCQSRSLH